MAAKVETTLPLWHPVAHLQLIEDLQLTRQAGGEVLPALVGGALQATSAVASIRGNNM